MYFLMRKCLIVKLTGTNTERPRAYQAYLESTKFESSYFVESPSSDEASAKNTTHEIVMNIPRSLGELIFSPNVK